MYETYQSRANQPVILDKKTERYIMANYKILSIASMATYLDVRRCDINKFINFKTNN